MKHEELMAALDEELRFQMGGASGVWVEALTHIFAALEARGLCVVPKEATEATIKAADAAGFARGIEDAVAAVVETAQEHADLTGGELYIVTMMTAAIEALSQEQTQ